MLSEIRKQNEKIVEIRKMTNQMVAEVREKLNNNHNVFIRKQKAQRDRRIKNVKDDQMPGEVLKGQDKINY